jgi:PleD family two-component response regulator
LGVARVGETEESFVRALSRAEKALALAKAGGRDRVVCEQPPDFWPAAD